jgi:hypothetical protein
MGENLDWSGVPAGLLAEVKRRVAILEAYLALPKPTKKDRSDAMSQLGVRHAMFYRMLRAWKQTRNPAELPGARRDKCAGRNRKLLPPTVEQIIAEVLVSLGPGARPETIVTEIRARCSAAGVRPPSRMTIRHRRRNAAAVSGAADG